MTCRLARGIQEAYKKFQFVLTAPFEDKEELSLIHSQDTERYLYVAQYKPWANKDRKSVSPSAMARSEVAPVLLSDAH